MLAALLKHNGLALDAMKYANYLQRIKDLLPKPDEEGKDEDGEKGEEGGNEREKGSSISDPPVELTHVWLLMHKEVRAWLQRNKVLSVAPPAMDGSQQETSLFSTTTSTPDAPVTG